MKSRKYDLFVGLLAIVLVSFTVNGWHVNTASAAFKIAKTPRYSLNNGLVGWWRFDGGDVSWSSPTAGTVIDASGGGRTGTLTNMTQNSSISPGKIGQGIALSGTSYVSLASSPFSSFPVTGCVWVKPRPFGSPGDFIRIIYDYGFRIFIYKDGASSYTVGVSNGFVTVDAGSGSATMNAWQHICASIDAGNNALVYINGIQRGSGNVGVNAIFGGLNIGASLTPNEYFNGYIDDVRIYNRVLSSSEIKDVYNIGSAKVDTTSNYSLTNGLVAWWTLDGKDTNWTSATAGTVADRSENNRTGTLTNMDRSTAPIVGKIGQAINFDSVNDEIDAGSTDFLGTTALTIAAWVYPHSPGPGGNGRLISNGRTVAISNTLGRMRFISNGATEATSASNCMIYNQWTYLVITRDAAGSTNFYCNSVLSGTADQTSGAPAAGTENVIIGNRVSGSEGWDGIIDDLRVYNRVLLIGEIKELYSIGSAKVDTTPKYALTTGLVGWWSFDGADTSWTDPTHGTTIDKSGNNNGGLLQGMNQTFSPVSGRFGQAYTFDGTAADVRVDQSTTINTGDDLSVSFWMKSADTRSSGSWFNGSWLFDKDVGGAGSSDGSLVLNGGQLVFTTGNGVNADDLLTSVKTVNDNAWHHIAITRVRTTGVKQIYIDGVYDNSLTQSTNSISNVTNMVIGGSNGGDPFYRGIIDDARMYSRALSATEIKQLYLMGK